jgi:hypothetical protein
MILHLIESDRHVVRPAPSTLWSVGAHAALALALFGDGLHPRAAEEAPAPTKEVLYFLPLLPSAPPPEAVPDLVWRDGPIAGIGDGVAPVPVAVGDLPARGGGGAAARRVETLAAVDSGPLVDASAVYLEAQLDQPVERDPRSAGPIYPEALRVTNTEGAVLAEWVVDTLGNADAATFRVVSSTHQLFSDAVRAVLPQMFFRPAELQGQRVRQLVRQEFRFQLARPVAVRDSVG